MLQQASLLTVEFMVALCPSGICGPPKMSLWELWFSEKLLSSSFQDRWDMVQSSGSGSHAEEEQFQKMCKKDGIINWN